MSDNLIKNNGKGDFITGIYVDSEVVKPSKKSDYKELRIALNVGYLQNVIISASPDYKIEVKKGDLLTLPVGFKAQYYDETSKRFQYCAVSRYVRSV